MCVPRVFFFCLFVKVRTFLETLESCDQIFKDNWFASATEGKENLGLKLAPVACIGALLNLFCNSVNDFYVSTTSSNIWSKTMSLKESRILETDRHP